MQISVQKTAVDLKVTMEAILLQDTLPPGKHLPGFPLQGITCISLFRTYCETLYLTLKEDERPVVRLYVTGWHLIPHSPFPSANLQIKLFEAGYDYDQRVKSINQPNPDILKAH